MKVKVLGSVSPYSKGMHNCPGYLVTNNNNKVLLDCGNGITRLMNMKEDLNNLSIIISHLHKDHYGELLSIGYASYIHNKIGNLKNKIPVYIPNDKISDHDFLNNFGNEHFLEFRYYDSLSILTIGDMSIDFCLNPHQIKTYSVRIKYKNSVLVYSGDTGYKDNNLEKFAKGADLFICESTFLKGQDKGRDNHLYAYEAAIIAKEANVDKLLLTHFWPEIDKNLYVKEAIKFFDNTKAAEEGKTYNLKNKSTH